MKSKIVRFIIVVSVCSLMSCGILQREYAEGIETSFCYKGQWSEWKEHRFALQSYYDWRIYCSRADNGDIIGLDLRTYAGFSYFSFKISDYEPGKKVCSGFVNYYVNDAYPTAEELARANYFVKPNYRLDKTPSVRRTARATIKIVNDERQPAVFNLWYDNIGFAISVRNVHWSN